MSVLVESQIDVRRVAGSPVRSRRALLDGDRRPCAQMRFVPTRAGGPRQPASPLPGAYYQVVASAAAASPASTRSVAGREEITLTDRGLVVMMIGLTLAVLLGVWIVVSQYLALAPGLA